MEIEFSSSFRRYFRKQTWKHAQLEASFWQQLELFIENLFHPALPTHRLSGKLKGLWSFSIRYDMRVVSTFLEEKPKRALLIVMGTHDEVY